MNKISALFLFWVLLSLFQIVAKMWRKCLIEESQSQAELVRVRRPLLCVSLCGQCEPDVLGNSLGERHGKQCIGVELGLEGRLCVRPVSAAQDRKSTRLNPRH